EADAISTMRLPAAESDCSAERCDRFTTTPMTNSRARTAIAKPDRCMFPILLSPCWGQAARKSTFEPAEPAGQNTCDLPCVPNSSAECVGLGEAFADRRERGNRCLAQGEERDARHDGRYLGRAAGPASGGAARPTARA